MNRKRPKQIVIRLSEEEYDKLKGKIAESGMKQQDYLIKCLLEQKVTNTDGLKELVPEVKRIGNNINQIAKKVNSDNSSFSTIDKTIFASTKEGFDKLWQQLRQSIHELV